MFRLAALISLLVLTASPSWAAPSPPPAAAGPADVAQTAEREALARRYFVAAHLDSTINTVLKSLMPAMTAETLDANPDLKATDHARISDVMNLATRESVNDILPEYTDGVVKAVSKVYSLEELKALVAFYESPAGQSVIAKNAQLAGPVTQIMMGLMPKIDDNIERHVCEHLKCDTGSRLAARNDS